MWWFRTPLYQPVEILNPNPKTRIYLDEFGGVVVVDADEHVVRTGDDPRLAQNELGRAHRKLSDLMGLGFRM